MTNSVNTTQTAEATNNAIPETKKGFIDKKVMKIGGVVVAMLGLAAATYFGIGERKGDAATIENTPTTTEQMAPANTSANTAEAATPVAEKPSETTAETLPTIESLELDASLMSDPEALARKYFEIRNTWTNSSGEITKKISLTDEPTAQHGDLKNKSLDTIDDRYIKALYPGNWADDDLLRAEVARNVIIRNDTQILHRQTGDHFYVQDIEAYKRFDVFGLIDQATQKDGILTTFQTSRGDDNSTSNRVEDDKLTRELNHTETSYKVIDGAIKVIRMEYYTPERYDWFKQQRGRLESIIDTSKDSK